MSEKKLKVINLLAGPGAGKSTIRAEIFSKMKKMHIDVEEATEFAKDLTYEKNFAALSDQLYILGTQNRRLSRLTDEADWVVTDSPLLLGIHYVTPDFLPNTFKNLILELWGTYDNYNFYLERTQPYQQMGRKQTETEALQIDSDIKNMLINYSIPHVVLPSDNDTADNIIHLLNFMHSERK